MSYKEDYIFRQLVIWEENFGWMLI